MARTVVITGTKSGFGSGSVQRFAAEGWNVVATVRNANDLKVHSDLPSVRTLHLDVNDEKAALGFAEQAVAQFGQVDALVNNAGYYQMGPVEATTMKQIRDQFETNVFGLIAVTKGFLPIFREQRSGVIVNISSISSEYGYPFTAVYAASKAAVATFSEGLNIELAPFGATAKAVHPGQMATKIFGKIDMAKDVPEAYVDAVQAFADLHSTGSLPAVTVEVVYEAVTDGKHDKVHYFSGPDGEAIPRAQQLLGPEWFWKEFRAQQLGKPSALWESLQPFGDVPTPLEYQ